MSFLPLTERAFGILQFGRTDWLSRWATLALPIMVLNDHFMKFAIPSFFTGKLSDLCDPFVLYRLLRGIPTLSFGLGVRSAGAFSLACGVLVKINQNAADFVTSHSCALVLQRCALIADSHDIYAYIPFALLWAREMQRNHFIF